jgi:hypothetical protein
MDRSGPILVCVAFLAAGGCHHSYVSSRLHYNLPRSVQRQNHQSAQQLDARMSMLLL